MLLFASYVIWNIYSHMEKAKSQSPDMNGTIGVSGNNAACTIFKSVIKNKSIFVDITMFLAFEGHGFHAHFHTTSML